MKGRGRDSASGKQEKQALRQLYFRKNFTNLDSYTFAYMEKY